jgi:hypothetical protein
VTYELVEKKGQVMEGTRLSVEELNQAVMADMDRPAEQVVEAMNVTKDAASLPRLKSWFVRGRHVSRTSSHTPVICPVFPFGD